MIDHPSAPPGKARKYARLEAERRFLLVGRPPGQSVRTVLVTDRYLTGTRVRLRRIDSPQRGTAPIFKLTQKIPAPDGRPGLITTFYLDQAEYDFFATLPAAELTKRRESFPPFGVDEFGGALTGLWLAEAEFDSEEECAAMEQPPFAVAEVTLDIRFTGGRLAVTDAASLAITLREFGIHRG